MPVKGILTGIPAGDEKAVLVQRKGESEGEVASTLARHQRGGLECGQRSGGRGDVQS